MTRNRYSRANPETEGLANRPWLTLMAETAAVVARTGGMDWLDDAACGELDVELFFPAAGKRGDDAKAVCAGCPVRAQCAEWSQLSPFEFGGVIAGTTTGDRRAARTRERLNASV